jgi:hypothetical protein
MKRVRPATPDSSNVAGATLSMLTHGLHGISLGVVGIVEYAASADRRELFPRPASTTSSCGGWRLECSVAHAARFAEVPAYRAVTERLASLPTMTKVQPTVG